VLDLGAVLDFSEGDNLDDFVRLTPVNSNTSVEVDPNGGGDDFTVVFNLIGQTGLNLDTLVADGNVQANGPAV
jgi:hypothetical protein